jgi:hypothetical protein
MKTLSLTLTIFLVLTSYGICYATDFTQDPYCQGAWLFEEGGGTTVADSSLHLNTGAVKGLDEPAWDSSVPASYAAYSVDFDGIDDYINCGNDPTLQMTGDLSVVCWVYPTAANGTWDKAISKGEWTWGIELKTSINGYGFTVHDGSTWKVAGGGIYTQGAWTHLAGIYDYTSGEVSIWVNGTKGDRTANAFQIANSAAYPLSIGRNPYGMQYSQLKIAEVAVFDRVLSSAEIQDIMNNGLKGSGGSASPPQSGDMPQTIRFQANLQDYNADPLEGTFAMDFRLYDTDIGGTPLWQETQSAIYVEAGALDVELGSVNALDLPFDKQYWLGVEIESDGEMTPRFKLTTVPYAFKLVQ